MATTNAEDLQKAEQLQRRLQASEDDDNDDDSLGTDTGNRIPNVTIDEGAHKYVLISAILPGGKGERQYFVFSKRGAEYHRNAAEPMVDSLENSGYSNIR